MLEERRFPVDDTTIVVTPTGKKHEGAEVLW
jgi:hypothetical protein